MKETFYDDFSAAELEKLLSYAKAEMARLQSTMARIRKAQKNQKRAAKDRKKVID
jgi:hypothetical protein